MVRFRRSFFRYKTSLRIQILFSYLINSLIEEIYGNNKYSVQVKHNTHDISALLIADDVALLSDTV